MKTLYSWSTIVLALACVTIVSTARAQDDFGTDDSVVNNDAEVVTDAPEADKTYPVAITQRPLTLVKGMLRATGTVTIAGNAPFFGFVGGTGTDTFASMNIGASIGVMDNLEVGINSDRVGSSWASPVEGLIPLIFAPDFDYGDIPVYGRYRFLEREMVQIAADLVLVIPSNTDFAIEVGLPVRLFLTERLNLDTGVEVRGTLQDPFKHADIRIPALITFNITDAGFIGGQTGVNFVGMGENFDSGIAIPLAVRGGYTLARNDNLIDFFGQVGWRDLILAGTGRDTVDADGWEAVVGVAFHTKPLF